MINFSALPTESPNALPPVDLYYADIVEAQMKSPKDVTKPDYLNVKYRLTNAKGESKGNMYDMFFDSESSVLQYKLGRFVRACGIPLQGAMELKDLAKLVLNKKVVIDVKHDEGSDKYPAKAVVNVFEREAYYLPSEFAEIHALMNDSDTEEAPAAEVGTVAPAPTITVEY